MSFVVQNDGAGGKPQFITIIGTKEVFRRLGWEIIVMVIDDIARNGDLPILFSNDVNAKKVTEKNFHLVEAMFQGFGEILKETSQINTTGEFAIMKHSITAFCDKEDDEQLIVNWAGTGIGISHINKKIDGHGVTTKLPIVGFWEPGYRCNGGTQHTNVILRKWGHKGIQGIWESEEAMAYINQLTTPSRSYAKTICRANGWINNDGYHKDAVVKMLANAHHTGGGFGKLKEILPEGVGARINNLPRPADVLLLSQEYSQEFPDLSLTDSECHTTLHGGIGWSTICASMDDAEKLIAMAKEDGSEAYLIGETIADRDNSLYIDSRFLEGKKNIKL